MNFDLGLNINFSDNPLGITYGEGVFGPNNEIRKLNEIRHSLMNPDCEGPETVYAIAMDVGKLQHKRVLDEKMLLFGVVTYSLGALGREPIKSQGHIHKVSPHSGWSPPEVYQILGGSAVVYMQEYVTNFPGRCFAVYANKGDIIIVPPNWAHATISEDPFEHLSFGAWCDREYAFLYQDIRDRKGLAWYALVNESNELTWHPNLNYEISRLVIKKPEDYFKDFGIKKNESIYSQFENNPLLFDFVSDPALKESVWKRFIP